MAVNNLKAPPVLVDEDSYEEWKSDLHIWELYNDMEKKRQGPAVYLGLTGRARECIRDLRPDEIGAEGGVKKITDKLDTLFKKDINTQTYLSFKELSEYRRPSGMSITEFLVHYEYLYHKMVRFDIKLPEGVQAFLVLAAANVSEDNEKLARATCGQMTYANMKGSIQKIFGDPSNDNNRSAPAIKSEPVFHSDHSEDVHYTSGYRGWRGQGRRGSYNRSQQGSGYMYNRFQQSGSSYRRNPFDKDGQQLKCFKCGSTNHFARSCTSKNVEGESKAQVHITLLNGKSDKDMESLVGECFGKALLDSACTKTVCGETWINVYLDMLNEEEMSLVETLDSDTKFKFGDGVEMKSIKRMKIPATLGKKRVLICTDVVKSEIPLLMSRSSMKRANMVLDFVNDTVNTFRPLLYTLD